ncbi:SDR family NAD(P)-dependent oxidoreductase [Demequina pelophila]|uniref:SDR family NAD(P)-dependent oxidoreductase n=1 Tax=Demequina pelophila TaxID=1638984 RepID=UPI00078522D4|nr:SDR family NAD(P)-dependent oxidoreductase [Demequina pelophila]
MATALVTGASAGLGEEFAWQLATAGHRVVLVSRSYDSLSEVAELLSSATGAQAEILPADLTTEEGRAAVCDRLAQQENPVSMLVNNAGFGSGTAFAASAWDDERALLDIHITAPLQLTKAALPGMIERGHGAIVNVASIAAHLANSTYAAHKRWTVEFTQALAGQLSGTGVTATAVLPGLVRTRFHDSEALRHMRDEFPDSAWLEPEEVVTSTLAAVRRGAVTVTPSVRYAVGGALASVLPPAFTRRRRSQRRDS